MGQSKKKKIYNVKKLKDCVSIKGRIGWKGLKKSEFGKDGVLIINGPEIFNGVVNWEKCLRVPELRYTESPEIMVQEKNILMTKDGTIGKLAFVDKLPERATLASGVFRIESKTILPEFLFCYFQSKEFKELVISRTEGSVIPHLYQRDIEELEVPVPPIKEQKKIAEILFNLDSKVKLNQQMNRTLETIGEAIFRRWFVDFEFPNQEGKPYKSTGGKMASSELGEIPQNWLVGHYSDLVEVSTGKGLTRDRLVDDGKYPVLGANGEIGRTDDFLYYDNLILTGRVGTLGKVYLSNEKVWISDNVLISKAKSTGNYHYSYFILKSFDMETLNRGSTQPLVTQTDLKNQIVIIPEKETLINFEAILNTLFSKVNLNNQQNKTLSAIRDNLLPKLMSGKIRVPIDKENLEVT
jgi:type I restriction enzyme, S subunit